MCQDQSESENPINQSSDCQELWPRCPHLLEEAIAGSFNMASPILWPLQDGVGPSEPAGFGDREAATAEAQLHEDRQPFSTKKEGQQS